ANHRHGDRCHDADADLRDLAPWCAVCGRGRYHGVPGRLRGHVPPDGAVAGRGCPAGSHASLAGAHGALSMVQRIIRLLALVLGVAACSVGAPPPAEAPPVPGGVLLNQHTTNDYTGGRGTGSVYFQGTLYHFAASGLGVDGSAVAVMQLTGDVSNLHTMRQ